MRIYRVGSSGYGAEEYSKEEIRGLIYAIEEKLMELDTIVEIKPEHSFADGIYLRKILLPAGACLTGRIHKQDDLQIVFYGDISILTENGLVRCIGPTTLTSKAGVKPFAIAHTETLFATAHHTHLTDLAEIEKELFEENEKPLYDFSDGRIKQEAICLR